MCLPFGATYPDRARVLVLFGGYARRQVAPDCPWAAPSRGSLSVAALGAHVQICVIIRT